MKIIWNNKLFPSLNVINGKKSPYESKGIIRHYHYRSDPKLGPGVFPLEKFHVVAMLAHLYHFFIGIMKSENQLISLGTEEFIIGNTLKLLVVTIIGLY